MPQDFSLLREGFIGPDFELYWTGRYDVVLRPLPYSALASRRSEFQPLYEIAKDGDALKLNPLCQPKTDRSKLNHASYPNLSALLDTLGHIGGQAVPSGTLQSSSRRKRAARAVSRAVWVTPWAIGKGYNNKAVIDSALESWSYRDAWSRWKYLKFIEGYGAARDDLYWLIVNHYGGVPENIDGITDQTLNRLIAGHFIFRSDTPLTPQFYTKFDALIGDIFNESIEAGAFDSALEDAQTHQEGVNGVDKVHRLITAGLFSPKLTDHIIGNGKALEAPNFYGKMPLMVAAHIGNEEAVRKLIAAGVDISAELTPPTPQKFYTDKLKPEPRTALDYAVENSSLDIISDLLAAGGISAAPDMLRGRLAQNPNMSFAEREIVSRQLDLLIK